MPNIRVDRDVYKLLQERAQPFVDTPNSVLRRLLNLDPPAMLTRSGSSQEQLVSKSGAPRAKRRSPGLTRFPASRTRKRTHRSTPVGPLLPEDEYVVPLLTALAERGGSAPARELVETVGGKLDGKLTEADREKIASGAVRWQNRLQFVRLRLVEEGLLAKDSPRGIWALTDAGRARVKGGR